MKRIISNAIAIAIAIVAAITGLKIPVKYIHIYSHFSFLNYGSTENVFALLDFNGKNHVS